MKKVRRKQIRCEKILLKHEDIKTSSEPTESLYIGNGGLMCGVQRELLIEIFSQYGNVNRIIMLPEKSYSFLIYATVENAVKAMDNIHGQRLNSGHMFYMSYINSESIPKRCFLKKLWPEGLILLEDFITEEEERELLCALNTDYSCDGSSLKHRTVKHFGYEFIYGSNNINKSCKLVAEIPDVCLKHLEKLLAVGHVKQLPNQLTVNYYDPGQGIPPHIDTHSSFQDGIISLSLSSKVIMDFYNGNKESVSVLLPQRSALIMTGESRYLWKHGITPRKTDIIAIGTEDGCDEFTLCQRTRRISLTFRSIRSGECTCKYKAQCDSQISLCSDDLVDEDEAKELECKYVIQVYEKISDHFSDTRFKPWPKVASFLQGITPGSIVLDIGCGNGKNMGLSCSCFEIGCDASLKLATLCSERKYDVLLADCMKLPFRDNFVDVVICIAVIHHLATKVRRLRAVEELMRVLCLGGKALIYVWALEQDGPEGPSNYLKHYRTVSHKAAENSTNITFAPSADIVLSDSRNDRKSLNISVHRNRTNFVKQDLLVPWKLKRSSNAKEETVHHRYYHVFAKGELQSLIPETKAQILDSYYDRGNWCLLLQKLE